MCNEIFKRLMADEIYKRLKTFVALPPEPDLAAESIALISSLRNERDAWQRSWRAEATANQLAQERIVKLHEQIETISATFSRWRTDDPARLIIELDKLL